MPTEHKTNKDSGKKTVLEAIASKIVSFHMAFYSGNVALTAASKDSISSEELLRNQAIIESFYGGALLLLFFSSLLVDYLSGRTARVGITETCRAHIAGKKLEVFVSAPFSLVGAALLFSEYNKSAAQRNFYMLGFAFLFMAFSGYLSGGTTPSMPQSVRRFFGGEVEDSAHHHGVTPEPAHEPFEQHRPSAEAEPVSIVISTPSDAGAAAPAASS